MVAWQKHNRQPALWSVLIGADAPSAHQDRPLPLCICTWANKTNLHARAVSTLTGRLSQDRLMGASVLRNTRAWAASSCPREIYVNVCRLVSHAFNGVASCRF